MEIKPSKPNLPAIPAKRYFSIGEVAEMCDVKPHVLRYWEQEFTQLRPVKRRGNRRYYQHHEVLMIRRIRELLYSQGFTISGARNQLQDGNRAVAGEKSTEIVEANADNLPGHLVKFEADPMASSLRLADTSQGRWLAQELQAIRSLLS